MLQPQAAAEWGRGGGGGGGGCGTMEVEGLGKYKNCSLGVALKQTYITLLLIFFLSLKVLLKASLLYLHHLIIFKFH